MKKQTISAELYTVRNFTQNISDIAETLKKISLIGYRAVEIACIGPVDIREVAKITKDCGLEVCSTHTDWNRFLNELETVIEEHRILGCKHPAIGGLWGLDYYSADGAKRFLDDLAPISEKLAENGMDFSYHNHNHELTRYGDKTWLDTLYEKSDPDLLKAEIDVYWIQAGGGDPVQWIKKCANREPLLHLKDMTITPDRETCFAPLGKGNLNWRTILNAAEESGVEYLIVEQDECYGQDPFEALEESYRYLKEIKQG